MLRVSVRTCHATKRVRSSEMSNGERFDSGVNYNSRLFAALNAPRFRRYWSPNNISAPSFRDNPSPGELNLRQDTAVLHYTCVLGFILVVGDKCLGSGCSTNIKFMSRRTCPSTHVSVTTDVSTSSLSTFDCMFASK